MAYSFGRKKRLEPGTDLSYYHDDKTTGGSLANLSTLAKLAPGSSEYNKQRNIQSFAPLYMASPEPGSHSMIVVLFEFYPSGANATLSSLSRYVEQEASQDENRRLTVSICTVSAYWNFGEVLSLLPGGPYVVQTGPRSMSIPNKPRPITLNLTGVDELEGANFQGRAYAANPNKNAQLSIIFATVIANMNTSLVFPDPAGGLNRERAPDRDSSNSTELTYTFTRWGYGYNTWSTSIQLSIAVITAYCIVTLAYISYILTTGSTSTAWNSAIELVALALQSRKPDCLGHVGVGLDSLETFKEGVGIRVNNDNELELVFAHDREFVAGNLRKIERNKEY
ncbi:hypothetical protein N0V94_005673 [Neodidymelliopsis sp. IMI 364377]|nr:hypothetical protein N0V94_005673 [Neodidymelliopsis sp. IMI 364377]